MSRLRNTYTALRMSNTIHTWSDYAIGTRPDNKVMSIDNILLLTTKYKVRRTSILQLFTFVYYFQRCKRHLIVITRYGTHAKDKYVGK